MMLQVILEIFALCASLASSAFWDVLARWFCTSLWREYKYRSFRKTVLSGLTQFAHLDRCRVGENLRPLKSDLLQLHSLYLELDAVEKEPLLRYSDDREKIQVAAEATGEFAASLLARIYRSADGFAGYALREVAARNIPGIWRGWYNGYLPEEVLQALCDDDALVERSEQLTAPQVRHRNTG